MATPPTTPLLDRAAALGLSVHDLAPRLGVDVETVTRWLLGSRPVPDEVVPVLAAALEVGEDDVRGQ